MKEKHKSFFCPEPLSALRPLTVGVSRWDRDRVGKDISPHWKSPPCPVSIGGVVGGWTSGVCKRKHLQIIRGQCMNSAGGQLEGDQAAAMRDSQRDTGSGRDRKSYMAEEIMKPEGKKQQERNIICTQVRS